MIPDPNALGPLTLVEGDVHFDYHGWHARLAAVNDHLVRLTVTQAPDWPAHPSIQEAPDIQKHADATVASGGSGQRFDAPIVTATAHRPLTLTANTAALGAYRLVLEDGRLTVTLGEQMVCTLALPQLEDHRWTTRIRTTPGADYFGGGMQNGRVNLNGQLISIRNENRWTKGGVTSPVPFYWSTTGYGLLVNSFTPGEYDFANPHAGAYLMHEDPVFDAYLILATTPAGLIHGYHELTGLPALPPAFTFYPAHFNAYNRDYWVPVTQDSAGAIRFADGQWYKEYQPIKKETFNTGFRRGAITVAGVTLVPNVFGHGHVTFTEPDEAGNPRRAVRETLNGEHDPQFSARAVLDRYLDNGFPLGWLLPNDGYGAGYGQTDSLAGDLQNLAAFADYARGRGVTTGLWTQANLTPKDPAAPQKGDRDFARELDVGVRAIKTDVAWVGEGYTFGLNAGARAAAEFAKRQLRPAIVTLDGWAGSQRTGITWTGDQDGADWLNLAVHIGSYLSAGLSGLPNVASDVDGIYAGGNPVIQTRDLQWKAFTPHFFAMDGWGDQPKLMGMELPDPYRAINRAFLQFHTALLPTLYSLAALARDTGAPVIRPTFWSAPSAYTQGPALEDQFLLGDALLVAPIVNAYGLDGTTSRRDHVFLPAGTWYDFWTGEKLTGDATLHDLVTPLDRLPLFVREGAILALTAPHLTPDARPATRVIDWTPGVGRFTLVEDDGASDAYLRGEQARTELTGTAQALTIEATTGHFEGQAECVPLRVFVQGATGPATVTVDGQPLDVQGVVGPRPDDVLHRPATGLFLDLGVQSIRSTIVVTIQ
ncbi:TIM-barrel domain-containing protein [Lacticaseibacillus kribbianus]|uniref:TIM-barrel domain-containing protein n=1 Tax=Lacticaseibacillus kribbianus TaxID=2926292 RepID=UPI001CD50CBE|nr:TIM-barrel domain-containing protein [Lacticaseibacillus kribbianus]